MHLLNNWTDKKESSYTIYFFYFRIFSLRTNIVEKWIVDATDNDTFAMTAAVLSATQKKKREKKCGEIAEKRHLTIAQEVTKRRRVLRRKLISFFSSFFWISCENWEGKRFRRTKKSRRLKHLWFSHFFFVYSNNILVDISDMQWFLFKNYQYICIDMYTQFIKYFNYINYYYFITSYFAYAICNYACIVEFMNYGIIFVHFYTINLNFYVDM